MLRIRLVEEEIALRYKQEKMRCPVHLSIGQEEIPAVISQSLDKNDYMVSTHRGHAHYLSKGGDLKKMIAELYGKESGCSKGKGGSMHLIDLNVNFMGTSAIVGNSIPVGVGLGLSLKIQNKKNISVIFMGDGAIEEGVFYESVNFAILKNLPVLFICENNFYSVYSPLLVRQPKNRKIYSMVKAMGISSESGKNKDILEKQNLINKAIDYIRNGNGPYFLEFFSYRWREHCGPNYDNDIGYRSKKEFLSWKSKDPLRALEKELLLFNKEMKKKIISIQEDIINEINIAFNYAENSKFPTQEQAFQGVYAKQMINDERN